MEIKNKLYDWSQTVSCFKYMYKPLNGNGNLAKVSPPPKKKKKKDP